MIIEKEIGIAGLPLISHDSIVAEPAPEATFTLALHVDSKIGHA